MNIQVEEPESAGESDPARDDDRVPDDAPSEADSQIDAAVDPEPLDATFAADAVEVADAANPANPADAEICFVADSEPATELMVSNNGAPPSGPYEVVIEQEPSLTTHTIYRPRALTQSFPLVVWENGNCVRTGLLFAEFLQELASYGLVVIVAGEPYGNATALSGDGAALVQAMDWAEAEDRRPCGKYEHKLDTRKIAAIGASCGAGHALAAAADPRVSTLVLFNTGSASQSVLNALHQPVAYFFSEQQVEFGYANLDGDYRGITKGIPVFNAVGDVGFTGGFVDDNGGEFARVSLAWLRWQLQGLTGSDGSDQFEGNPCGLEQSGWYIKKKNIN